MTPQDPLTQLRRELVYAKREIAASKRDRDKALEQWTKERARMIGERRELRAQIKALERTLYRYLDGQPA